MSINKIILHFIYLFSLNSKNIYANDSDVAYKPGITAEGEAVASAELEKILQ